MSRQAAGLLVPLAWLALHWPTFRWLARSLPTEDYSTSLVLLAVLAVLAGRRLLRALREGGSIELRPTPLPALVTLTAAVLFVLQEARFGSDLVGAALTGAGAYGLVGLFVSRAAWRAGLPAALLAIACLPLGHFANAYLGFTTRVLTAGVVQRLLSSLGIASTSVDTVLLLESGAMNVDLPCSGIRSAWTGLLLFLAFTCVRRVPLSARWAALGAGYAGLLFAANVARVTAIALIAGVARAGDLARLVHEPLGILTFTGASALAVLALRRVPAADAPVPAGPPSSSARHPWPFVLAATLVLLAAARRPLEATAPPTPAPLRLPEAIAVSPLPLSAAESALFSRLGGAVAEKSSLRWRGRAGSLLVVHADTWRAHHPPDHCLRGGGHRIDSDLPIAFPRGPRARLLSIDEGHATAVSWFQSAARTTNDFTERLSGELGGERTWALVTVVLEGPPPALDELSPLVLALRDAVASTLDPLGGTP